jgi:hypothetical protein
MAGSNLNRGYGGTRFPSEQDLAEQGVLGLLLEAHPGLRSVDEILREMTDDSEELAERDRIENAIRDLVRAGLAHRHSRFRLRDPRRGASGRAQPVSAAGTPALPRLRRGYR